MNSMLGGQCKYQAPSNQLRSVTFKRGLHAINELLDSSTVFVLIVKENESIGTLQHAILRVRFIK